MAEPFYIRAFDLFGLDSVIDDPVAGKIIPSTCTTLSPTANISSMGGFFSPRTFEFMEIGKNQIVRGTNDSIATYFFPNDVIYMDN